jgi:tripartite-type tricarboxylate transporter receptor subunit TctC
MHYLSGDGSHRDQNQGREPSERDEPYIAAAEKTRLPELPNTPTIDETVPGVVSVGWNGLLAPAGTPTAIIDKLNAAMVAALKMPDIIAKMKLQGLHVLSSTPAELAGLLASEVDHWAKVMPSIGIQPQ